MQECLEDCCEVRHYSHFHASLRDLQNERQNCPEPIDDDERKLQADEDEQYTRGRLKSVILFLFSSFRYR